MKKIVMVLTGLLVLPLAVYGILTLAFDGSIESSTDRAPEYHNNQEKVRPEGHFTKISDLPGEGNYSGKLFFLNRQEGWMSVDNQLWRTKDGGKHWELIFENSTDLLIADFARIDAVLFENSNTGWLADSSNLYKTEDGGFTWIKDDFWTSILDKGFITSIYESKNGTLFVVGATYRESLKPVAARDAYRASVFFRTGTKSNWKKAIVPPDVYPLRAIEFVNKKTAVAIGEWSHEILISRNGGLNWSNSTINKRCVDKNLSSGFDLKPLAIAKLSENRLLVSYDEGRIIRSVDSGKTWCDFYSLKDQRPYSGPFQEFLFVDSVLGFGLKTGGQIFVTRDGGESWENIEFGKSFSELIEIDGEFFAVADRELYKIGTCQ